MVAESFVRHPFVEEGKGTLFEERAYRGAEVGRGTGRTNRPPYVSILGHEVPDSMRRCQAGSVGTSLTSGIHMIVARARWTRSENTPRLIVKSTLVEVECRLF